MDYEERSYLISKIALGNVYFDYQGQSYKIVPPTAEQIYLSHDIYKQEYNSLKYEDIFTDEQVHSLLRATGKWTNAMEQEIEDTEKIIKKLKIRLFKRYLQKSEHPSLRRQIRGYEKSLTRKYDLKSSLHHATKEYHCECVRNQFLVATCIQTLDNKNICNFSDFWIIDNSLVQIAIEAKFNNIISIDMFRKLARTSPWRNYWNIGKENVFNKSTFELTPDQQTLISYSKMYDNAYQHPDCPVDEVIKDDDMFDGWMLYQQEKREKEIRQRQLDKTIDDSDRASGPGEIFVPAMNAEEAQEIYDINDLNSRLRIKNRQAVAKRGETIEEKNLPDIQADFRKQIAEQFKGK